MSKNELNILRAFQSIEQNKRHLTRQQFRTLWGQAKAGDPDAAMKGLEKLIARRNRLNGR